MALVKERFRPETEESRATHHGTRLPTIFVNHDAITDSTINARVQFLAARYGMVGSYAALIAVLAFGGHHHG